MRLRTLSAVVVTSAALGACAAVPVDIEVAVVPGAPLDQMQTWSATLGKMDLARIRLRGGRETEQPAVSTDAAGGTTRYKVLALLTRDNQLLLPAGKFGLGDAKRLEEYFRALPDAMDEATIDRGRFGLTAEDFAKLHAAFSAPVVEPTVKTTLQEFFARETAPIGVPVRPSAGAKRALAAAGPLGIELQGKARGMTLALALRTAGLVLVPVHRREPLELRIEEIDARTDWDAAWPVGRKPEESPLKVAPQMYKATTVEIAGHSLAQVFAAMERPLGMPIVQDRFALAAAKFDPAKVQVKVPRKKLLVKNAIDTCLSQARVAGELRVDELGQAFYWVTRFGPTSPRATK